MFNRCISHFAALGTVGLIGAALVVLLAVLPVCAQSTSDQLIGVLVPSIDYFFEDRWTRSMSDTAPRILRTNEVTPDQIFCLYLFVSGYGVTEDGHAKVAFDLKIVDTSGTIVFDKRDGQALHRSVEDRTQYLPSQTIPFVTLEPWHAFGKYYAVVSLRDSVTGRTAEVTDSIRLVPYNPGTAPATDLALSEWMTTYYRGPQPSMLVDACISFVSGPMYDRAASPGYGFFEAALENNPQLIPILKDKLPTLSRPALYNMGKLLGSLDFSATHIGDSARIQVAKLLKGYKGTKYLSDSEAISKPDQLDYLWGRFFATGSYEPIRRIVSALNLEPYLKHVDPAKVASESRKPGREDVMKGAICVAAGWSLTSNAQQHELVRQYLVYMFSTEKLTEEERRQLNQRLRI